MLQEQYSIISFYRSKEQRNPTVGARIYTVKEFATALLSFIVQQTLTLFYRLPFPITTHSIHVQGQLDSIELYGAHVLNRIASPMNESAKEIRDIAHQTRNEKGNEKGLVQHDRSLVWVLVIHKVSHSEIYTSQGKQTDRWHVENAVQQKGSDRKSDGLVEGNDVLHLLVVFENLEDSIRNHRRTHSKEGHRHDGVTHANIDF